MDSFKLNTGYSIPSLGFGTWLVPTDTVGGLLENAIDVGYRHLDLAAFYQNEPEVGEALSKCFKSGAVKREDLFITSKLWNDKHKPEDVRPALLKTLKDLQLDYLDLYLIHWPVALKEGHGFPLTSPDECYSWDEVPIADTWAELEKAVDDGLVRSIGVSNFSAKKLDDLLKKCRIPPAVNQVECHPYLQLPDLHRYCAAKNIHITAFSPLGNPGRPDVASKQPNEPSLLQDETILKIAEKHKVNAGQVLLHWGVACGPHSVLCKSSSKERMKQNQASLTALTFDDEDKAQLKALDKHYRYISGAFWCVPNGPYTLENIWDENVSVDSLLK